ncbi:Lipopolysaccharide-modifying protein [Sesbania bispinosa]|nr:Lipopolysaccharide-modifying protein [Sesbania bispinosa]
MCIPECPPQGNYRTSTCPKDYLTTFEQVEDSSAASTCPENFKWIHEDLKPWKSTGITREMLLRFYPGNIPDLELLFETGDVTVVDKQLFQGPQAMSPPPIFHYCGQNSAFDIVFPDWTFWGWAEVGIRPWETMLQNIQEGNKKIKWKDRIPYAFWKGNTRVSLNRFELRACNASDQYDWNARIYSLHWDKEIAQGFQNTKLEDQCTHRYKIYVEGVAWSHFWPIRNQNMCEDIKYAVDWGNTHPDKAEEIGRAGTGFIEENLKMKFVYDYMFHLLTEYAKLLRFEPTIPKGAVEICSETVACPMDGLWRQYMVESMVKSPSDTPPCTMSSPYDEEAIYEQ